MPNVKNLLSHPLGDLGVTHRVRLWLDEKRIVNFIHVLVIVELCFASSRGRGTIKRNLSKSAFSEGVG